MNDFLTVFGTLLIIASGIPYIIDVIKKKTRPNIVSWFTFNNPTVAIVATVSIDFIAALPTFRHSWLQPGEETWQTFLASGIGAGIGILSLQTFSINSLACPSYLVLIGVALAGTIVLRRIALHKKLF